MFFVIATFAVSLRLLPSLAWLFSGASRILVRVVGILGLLMLLLAPRLSAFEFQCAAAPGLTIKFDTQPGSSTANVNCFGNRCYEPKGSGHFLRLADPTCDGMVEVCDIQLRVPLEFPGNNQDGSGLTPLVLWFDSATPPAQNCTLAPGTCGEVGICGVTGQNILEDFIDTYIEIGGFSCANLDHATQYSVKAYNNCWTDNSCRKFTDVGGLEYDRGPLRKVLGCVTPKPDVCPKDPDSCESCKTAGGPGGGGASGAGGGGGTGGVGTGSGAFLYYAAGGAGELGTPGEVAWRSTMGRYWSHSYAQRIFLDPALGDDSHVWLVTEFATFREFRDLVAGVYQTNGPSDEYRTLSRPAAGWELKALDGTVTAFDNAGLWLSTTDRNGNAKVATNNGIQLTSVAFPDSRREDFTYHPSGKLATITEVGIDGTSKLSWSYTWTGDDLVRIDRPDGTAWRYLYGDAANPGYMTRQILEGNDGPPATERIVTAWEYDAQGNAVKLWSGADDPASPDAVGKWEFAFDDPVLPVVTTVTDPLGNTSTYRFARDTESIKPKVTEISGDCPVCGTGPNSIFAYTDPAHPLRRTQMTDGTGDITEMQYAANGQLTLRIEAAGTALLERITEWEYDLNYPAFPTLIRRPSTSGLGFRESAFVYDPTTGNLTQRTETGKEATRPGGTFSLMTLFPGYTSSGQLLTLDPPGFGQSDSTNFTYDPARGDLFAVTRTDPLIGTTSFVYDPFNRRTGVTEVNGVLTETRYDPLDRVTDTIQRNTAGAQPGDPIVAGDLVTQQDYTPLGDLFHTILPRGNLIEYGYDSAGRLTSIERKPDAATSGERTVYQLDGAGNRTREELQRWDGAAFVVESFTDYDYSTRCYLDRIRHADGTATEYAYDCDGNLERVWDANHPSAGQTADATTVYTYDALDRLTTVIQPWDGTGGGNAVTQYGYDVQDHLTSVTDAEGNLTSYTYSDRDLLTEELSVVSGTTTHGYNDHGELEQTTDARGVVSTRILDELDRVTSLLYTPFSLNVAYSYDTAPASCAVGEDFAVGRLGSITRKDETIDYCYDRFGRVTRDGTLTYSYDANGNRETIGYPVGMTASGVTARYVYDFADRQQTLTAERAGLPDQPLVTGAAYAPSGPLKALTLGNGLAETRAHTTRYFPDRITATGGAPWLDWAYTTDAVGNPTLIDDLLDANPANDRVYNYQDFHYFLTQGDGPWGQLSWSYDKIGNRLSETRDTVQDTYTYQPGTGGNTALLNQIQLGAGGTRSYTYGLAGHLEQIDAAGNQLTYTHDDAGRLARIARPAGSVEANQLYDGRGFLISATEKPFDQLFVNGFEEGDAGCWDVVVGGAPGVATCLTGPTVIATYSSEGLLQQLDTQSTLATPAIAKTLFHFAGRPVAIRALPTGGTETWQYLTTDHLGTPILATDETGLQLWQGGFEPFGQDYAGAQTAGVFLRFPGQWDDEAWSSASLGAEGYYNVHRWYEAGTGRYGRADPLGLYEGPDLYNYANQNPLTGVDSLGLAVLVCSRKAFQAQGGIGNHAYLWDDRPGTPPEDRFCGIGKAQSEAGPGTDACNYVPGSEGRENQAMECCQFMRRWSGIYVPFLNDCQTGLNRAMDCAGLDSPGVPGGRLGMPCDQCSIAAPPDPRISLMGQNGGPK